MDKIELDALVRKAELHDHEAQTILGEYYLNSPTNSNSNFSRAEKYLRMAAEKHQKQAMESLIKLYYKYMSFLITENKRYAQIAMCFRLGIKWCKIGNSLGYDFINYQNQFIESFSKANENNNKIDLNYKYKKKFKKHTIITSCITGVTLALFLVCLLVNPISKTLIWIAPLIMFCLGLITLVLIQVLLIKLLKNKKITSYMVKDDDIEQVKQKNDIKLSSNTPVITRLKKIFNYDNYEQKNLNAIQRGLLGECFVEYLISKKAKVLFEQIQKKLNPYNEQIKKIEWINKGVETSDPFDFIIHTVNGKKIYMDIKTSWNGSNNVFLSYIQKNFCENIINEGSTYFICRLNFFWFKTVDDFLVKDNNKFIRLRIYDLKLEEDKSKLHLIYHD